MPVNGRFWLPPWKLSHSRYPMQISITVFQALRTKRAAIEHSLKVIASRTLTNQGLASLFICGTVPTVWKLIKVETLIITICARLELYVTKSFIYCNRLWEKKSISRFLKFAPLRHFVPRLFQLGRHAPELGSDSPVWKPYAECVFKKVQLSCSEMCVTSLVWT